MTERPEPQSAEEWAAVADSLTDGPESPFEGPQPDEVAPRKRGRPRGAKTASGRVDEENPFAGWTEELVAEGISSIYQGVGILRRQQVGPEWDAWDRSPSDCAKAARPIMRWLRSLPPETFARIERNMPATAAGIAIWNLTWPGLIAEWELYQARREYAISLAGQARPYQGPDTAGDRSASTHGGPAADGAGGDAAPHANGKEQGGIRLPRRTPHVR